MNHSYHAWYNLDKQRYFNKQEVLLSRFLRLVSIKEPCPNLGTLSQFRNRVPIQEPCPNLGNLFKIQNSTTKPSLPFKKSLQFIQVSYLPFYLQLGECPCPQTGAAHTLYSGSLWQREYDSTGWLSTVLVQTIFPKGVCVLGDPDGKPHHGAYPF